MSVVVGSTSFFLLTGGTGSERLIIFMEGRSEPSVSMIDINRQKMKLFNNRAKLFLNGGK